MSLKSRSKSDITEDTFFRRYNAFYLHATHSLSIVWETRPQVLKFNNLCRNFPVLVNSLSERYLLTMAWVFIIISTHFFFHFQVRLIQPVLIFLIIFFFILHYFFSFNLQSYSPEKKGILKFTSYILLPLQMLNTLSLFITRNC